jgi:hypothetical protein
MVSWPIIHANNQVNSRYGSVVPTTTPPLVWPSNGQNKGAPTKFFESYICGGLD